MPLRDLLTSFYQEFWRHQNEAETERERIKQISSGNKKRKVLVSRCRIPVELFGLLTEKCDAVHLFSFVCSSRLLTKSKINCLQEKTFSSQPNRGLLRRDPQSCNLVANVFRCHLLPPIFSNHHSFNDINIIFFFLFSKSF